MNVEPPKLFEYSHLKKKWNIQIINISTDLRSSEAASESSELLILRFFEDPRINFSFIEALDSVSWCLNYEYNIYSVELDSVSWCLNYE